MTALGGSLLQEEDTATLEALEDFRSHICQYESVVEREGFWRFPRYGQYSLMMRRVPVLLYDHPVIRRFCQTAFTEGHRVWIDIDFFRLMLEDELTTGDSNVVPVLLHELTHILWDHTGRHHTHNARLRNVAQDMVINITLMTTFQELRFGRVFRMGIGTSEQERRLFKNMSETEIMPYLDASVEDKACEHPSVLELRQALEGAGDRGLADEIGLPQDVAEQREHDERARARAAQESAETVRLHRQAGHDAGALPGKAITAAAFERIEALRTPRLDWRLALRSAVLACGALPVLREDVPDVLYYIDPAVLGLASSPYTGSVVPGATDTGVVLIVIDTSASVGTTLLEKFLGEVAGLLGTASDMPLQVLLVCGDVVIRDATTSPRDPAELLEELRGSGLHAAGRGGTHITDCVRQALALECLGDQAVSSLIYFTDLEDHVPYRSELPKSLPETFVYIVPKGARRSSAVQASADYARIYEME